MCCFSLLPAAGFFFVSVKDMEQHKYDGTKCHNASYHNHMQQHAREPNQNTCKRH